MNLFIVSLNENDTKPNWLEFYVRLSILSKSIRSKDKKNISDNLTRTIYDVLCFAKQNDINMDSCWNRWKYKMDYKNYD